MGAVVSGSRVGNEDDVAHLVERRNFMERATISASRKAGIDPQELHGRILSAYEALGYPHNVVGSWAISDNDIDDFIRLAVDADPRKILEVGTFVGVSTMLLALACPKARIVTVDPDFPLSVEMSAAGSDLKGVDETATTFDIARRVAADLGVLDRIRFVRGGFAVGDTFSSQLRKDGETIDVVGPALCAEEGPFDLAFVDGLHFADAVEADLILAAGAIRADAPIILHDCVGFWGANVRSGVFAFLRTRPDYVFSHPRYAQVYKSVGVVRPRGDGRAAPGRTRTPFKAGEVSPPIVQAVARLTAAMVGPRPIVELCFGVPILGEGQSEEGYASVRLGGRQASATSEAQDRDVAAFAAALAEAEGGAVFSAELLDFAPEPFLARLIKVALARGAPLVLTATPPGEEGVAGPFSRPLAAVVDLVQTAGGVVYAQPALDIEPERYALLPQARHLGETSLFTSFIVVAPPGGFTAAQGRVLAPLSPEAASEREQLELERTHLTAGYRRYYQDWRKVVAANEQAAERIHLLESQVHTAQGELDEAASNLRTAIEVQMATAAEVRDFAARFAEIAASLVEFERERAAAVQSIVALSEQNAGAIATIAALSQQRDEASGRIAALSEERAEAIATIAVLSQQRAEALDSVAALSQQRDEAVDALEALSEQYAEAMATVAARSEQVEAERASVAAHAAKLEQAEARHADLSAQADARSRAAEGERLALAAELEVAQARQAALLGVAIDVFGAMDVLDRAAEQQVNALAGLGFEGAPPPMRSPHEDGFDLLDIDAIAPELALMRANAKWITEHTAGAARLLKGVQAENEALSRDNLAMKQSVRQIHASTSWRLTAPLRTLRSIPGWLPRLPDLSKRLIRAKLRGRKLAAIQQELSRQLPPGVNAVVFDADWYATVYGDVSAEKALQHYLMFGEEEGRCPHRKFDPDFYRAQYPDVAKRHLFLLLHFLKFGLPEGRSPSEALHPLQDKASAAELSPLEFYARA
jgi:predicted O-methyltransferase YrrM